MIDLQQTAFVNHVRIYNRRDCCAFRLDNFQIRIGDSSTFANNPACVTGGATFENVKDFACVLTGRYVSLQQFNNQLMNLHEMEVYGRKTSNLARACSAGGCPVTTSSVLHPDNAKSNIVDENTKNAFISTYENNPWLMIDFEQTVFVTMVRIWNRWDCCQQRLNNFEIRVGNAGTSDTFSSNSACASNQPTFSGSKDFTCVLSGRYLTLRQFTQDYLQIAELEVFGLKASEVCTACLPGTFKSATGSAACADCAAGKYQDVGVVTTNPPEASRTYESVWGNSAPGTDFARSMLDSAAAWSWTGALPEWMQIDLGSEFRVHGVVTQCRANYEQCPHEIEVQHSLTASSFVSATAVGGTTRFSLPTTWSSTLKTSSIFSTPVTARYIRIVVHAGSSFRAGVLTLAPGVESNPPCTTTSNLVAHYSFDDSGDMGKDSNPSTTKYHLTPTVAGGTGGYDSALKVRGGSFKATNDGDMLEGNFPIKTIYDNSVSGISVSVWFYKKSGTTYDNIYNMQLFQFYKAGTTLEFAVQVGHYNGVHNLNWATTYSTGQTYANSWAPSQTLDTWHHLVVSLSKTGIFKAYVNGVNINLVVGSGQGSITAYGGSAYPVPQFADVDKLRIFRPADAKFSGNVDEFSVFNKELSQSEVTELYNACQTGGAGTNACADCGAGKYSAATGATAAGTCQACPGGALSPAGSDALGDCVAAVCAAGSTGPDGGPCTACAAGKFKTATGSAACTDCGAGNYSAATGATAAGTCQSCPTNSQSTTGSDAPTDCVCVAGFSGADGGTCTACAAGTYKNTIGNIAAARAVTGIQQSYPISSISTFGCTVCYDARYDGITTTSHIEACKTSAGSTGWILMGSKASTASTSFELLAAIKGTNFVTSASETVAYLSNGAYWYYFPTLSVGFAPASNVYLSAADYKSPDYVDCAKRLSWHLIEEDGGEGGYRSGCINNLLFDDTIWRKIMYYCNADVTIVETITTCDPCPANSYHALTGRTAASACQCNAGTRVYV